MERRASNICPTAHKAPPAPYYAVIFSSTLADDAEGYGTMADRMVALAREQEGFIDVESAARTTEGFGITVSYWRDLESIRKWKKRLGTRRRAENGPRRVLPELPAAHRPRRTRVGLRTGRVNIHTRPQVNNAVDAAARCTRRTNL